MTIGFNVETVIISFAIILIFQGVGSMFLIHRKTMEGRDKVGFGILAFSWLFMVYYTFLVMGYGYNDGRQAAVANDKPKIDSLTMKVLTYELERKTASLPATPGPAK